MTWLKRRLGLDLFDLIIHAGVTAMLMGFVGMSDGPEEVLPLMVATSLVILGVRRHFGLKRLGPEGLTTGQMAANRFEELEQRVGELEAAQVRIVELEERLDFTERLLSQSSAEHKAIGGDR